MVNMSWIQDEWKENLSSDAISHITTMETSLEKLQKDIAQYQFQTESLSSSSANLAGKLNEKEKELKESQRELSYLQVKLDEETLKCEELNTRLKNKNDLIYTLNTQLERLKHGKEFDDEELKNGASENNIQQTDYAKNGKQETIEKLETLLNEKNEQQRFYKDQVLAFTNEKNKLKRSEQQLFEKNAYLEQQIATLNAEKAIFHQHGLNIPHSHHLDKLEIIRRKKATEVSGCIGEYLGIDVMKSYSETQIGRISYAELLDENHRLFKELEKLRCIHNKDAFDEVKNIENNNECVVRVHSDILQTNVEAQIDSGVDLNSQTNHEKHNENVEELLGKLHSKKNEVRKLKEENLEMKRIYENHMKICGNQKYAAERVTTRNENAITHDNARTKSEMIGSLQVNMKSGFHDLQEKYSILENKLTDLSSKLNSNSIITKIEHLAEFISTENNTGLTFSTDCNPELDQLKSDLMSNFFSVQDEVHKGHLETREEIISATKEIIDSILYSKKVINGESNDDIGVRYFDEKCNNNIFHINPNNSVSELETIKERLGNIQHSISESINEKRRAELERNKLQEELVKMVETLKRKDKELGHLSQLCEDEKRKLNENDSCFRNEMEELRREQLEIYEEFRQMCETLKRKDIELANRNKQIKLLTAESREKEDELKETISSLQSDKTQVENEKEELTKHYHEKCNECDTLLKRFIHAEDQLRTIFSNLSKVEDICIRAKSQGLYK